MHRGRGKDAWREGAEVKPKGGFRFITVAQLCMGWFAYREGHIQLRDLRAWFACHEMLERRCMLERGRKPSFTFGEVQRITGGGGDESQAAASIRRLESLGLLNWSEARVTLSASPEQLRGVELPRYWEFLEAIPNRRRKVPVPRQVLRLLAGGARRGVIATVLGHMLRGLFYRSSLCCPNGAVTTSWVAETFGVGEATVKHARAHLVELGLLEPLPTPQLVMNRIGRWFRINLHWERPGAEQPVPVDNSEPPQAESTPPRAESTPVSTPLEENRYLPTGAKNQKPGSARPSGSFSSKGGEAAKPSLRNILREDLGDTGRLLELFDQATRAKLVDGGDVDRLRFVGAAEHAKTIGSVNPPGLFAWLVRNRRWSYVTDGDEDAANQRIKRHLYGDLSARPKAAPKPQNPFEDLSEDARFVRMATQLLPQRGLRGDPFVYVRRERPEWTRERWDAACQELDAARLEQARRNAMGGLGTLGELLPATCAGGMHHV
jgi:hypothetical protein